MQLCETKPIRVGVSSGKWQVHKAQQCVLRVFPLREETPCGVTTNTAVPCQTKPISPNVRKWARTGDIARDKTCETNPIPGMGRAMVTPSEKEDYDELDQQQRSEKQSQPVVSCRLTVDGGQLYEQSQFLRNCGF
jgi:hypothetical protein